MTWFQAFATWMHDVFVAQLDGWIVLGFVAQAMFTMRFVVQWIASEREKRSVVPIAFWFMPVQGMSQIYHGSIAETGSPDNSRLVSYWWTAWVLSVIGSTVANSSLAPLEVTYPALMIAMAFSVVAALLLRRLVGRITEAQQSILHTGAAQVFA